MLKNNLQISLIIFKKELLSELRTRTTLINTFLFSLYSTIMVIFAMGANIQSNDIISIIFWLIILFSAFTSLANCYTKENDFNTISYLKLSCSSVNIFWGKYFYNFLLLISLIIEVNVLFIVIFNLNIVNIEYYIIIMILGGLCLSLSMTIISAMICRMNNKTSLFTILTIPLILPVIITVISGTKIAFQNNNDINYLEVEVLLSYAIIMITIASVFIEDICHS